MPFDPNGNFTIPNNIVNQYIAGQKKADPAPLDANYNDIALGLAQLWSKTGQATETMLGIMALATSAEASAGTNDTKAMTPRKTKTVLDVLADAIGTEIDTLETTTNTKIATLTTNKVNYTDFTHGVAINGWMKLPSSFIIQWGRASSANLNTTAVTFPIAFPNVGLVCLGTGNQGSGNIQAYVTVNSVTPTRAEFNCFIAVGGQSPLLAGAGAVQIWWLAIGY